MAKLPKPPKWVPKGPPAKTPPINPRPQPTASRQPTTSRTKPFAFSEEHERRQESLRSLPAGPSPAELAALRRTKRITFWGKTVPLTAMSLLALGLGMYVSMIWVSLSNGPSSEEIPEDVSDRFDTEADGYDEKVNTAEVMLGIRSKRKALTQMVHGHVLEVAAGTGRNIPYYPTKKCATVTMLDLSAPMLAIAKRKWGDTHKEYFSRVFFKQQSALDPITPPFDAQEGYDTVIQTMGICSTPEPVMLLQSLEAVTKEDGKILLLEHGKSYFGWLNKLLDQTAPAHANDHGCWWNRDVQEIVVESGLQVVNIKRYNFGTTWWIELKPRKGIRQRQRQVELQRAKAAVAETPVVQAARPWWSLWR
ncbi:S-adenosyl-L-methionine-dependent methyltransferase [Polyplosphaeria fusca]|uniref:S-adenosyl-L-methionine-dependent methyltransferase n=1 Tax=Polyplosphaeria fusca TaxID=682080 RepID=A0A9P4QVN1_9PLEO|nr:S-adenosyl-L-methionine-dependent methyltransferase [Polyplosphaeria fusca]